MGWSHDDALRGMARRVTVIEVDDSGPQQKLRVRGLAGEELKEVVRVQAYGLSNNPEPGSEGVLLALGGRSDRAMLLGVENPNKRQTNLPPGGTALYGPNGQVLKYVGNDVTWDASGNMTITCAGTLTIRAAAIKFEQG